MHVLERVPVEFGQESLSSQFSAGRYSPAITINYELDGYTREHVISSGCYDEVHAYTDGECLFVLSLNEARQYVGVEVFESGERVADLFFQESQVGTDLGVDLGDTDPDELMQAIYLMYGDVLYAV